ncbi:DUF4265 domain-containing protein [Paucibacter sp. B2R-40]|uniref:DUF4265 domain-containing protein n=1 Tax=Paucibacter sp. B2R-40 TaxID=2893554 RepID=UPI0021E47ECD|nr:DUF4265 domain-containing protein [Paucibacter sp. B2R-40]MCV2357318.1 DUF4265 domain-containing protein [Paucibacter sp. B2R-40]
MEKLRFALDIEDDWPPVATESVWCQRDGDVFELQNAPFFISGLAWGDKFTATPDPVNGCVFDFNLVETSGHSLAWVLKNDGSDFLRSRAKLLELGCRVEGFAAYNLWSVDIPPTAAPNEVETQLDHLETQGFAVAVPVWRYET